MIFFYYGKIKPTSLRGFAADCSSTCKALLLLFPFPRISQEAFKVPMIMRPFATYAKSMPVILQGQPLSRTYSWAPFLFSPSNDAPFSWNTVSLFQICEAKRGYGVLRTTHATRQLTNGGEESNGYPQEHHGRDEERSRSCSSIPKRNRRKKIKKSNVSFSFCPFLIKSTTKAAEEKEADVFSGSEGRKAKGKRREDGLPCGRRTGKKHFSPSSALEINAATHPSQFRMLLLTRALRQHILLRKIEEKRKEVLGMSSLSVEAEAPSSLPCSSSSIVERKVLEDWCALCHITNSKEAIVKLIKAALIVPLDERHTLFHLRPAEYIQEMALLDAVKQLPCEQETPPVCDRLNSTGPLSNLSCSSCTGTSSGTMHTKGMAASSPPSFSDSTTSSSSFPLRHKEEGRENGALEDKDDHSSEEVEPFLEDMAPSLLESVVNARINTLEAEKNRLSQQLQEALERGGRWGRRVLLLTAFAIASQIAIVARLTFFELDWDTMEPITYCFGVFVTIVLYVFYMWYGKEYTYDEVFQGAVPSYVRRWAPKGFDWKRYEEVCQELEKEREIREKIREWTSLN